jgi:hypothetical protein
VTNFVKALAIEELQDFAINKTLCTHKDFDFFEVFFLPQIAQIFTDLVHELHDTRKCTGTKICENLYHPWLFLFHPTPNFAP